MLSVGLSLHISFIIFITAVYLSVWSMIIYKTIYLICFMIKNLISSVRGSSRAPDPVYLQIEPTSRCNLNCKMCFRDEAPYELNKDMSFELFKKIADLYKLKRVVLTGFGEPFLHKDIFRMIEYLSGVYVEVTSNAVILDEKKCEEIVRSNLNQINISIDGVETYEKIRGVSFDKVYSALEKIIDMIDKVYSALEKIIDMKKKLGRRTPKVMVNTVIIEDNRDDLVNVVDKLLDFPITLNLKTIRPNKNCKVVRDDELVKGLARRARGHKLKVKYSRYFVTPFCYRVYFGAYVNYRGDMYPCCDLFKRVGHVLEDGWNSKEFCEFRESFKDGMPKECRICNLMFNQRIHRYAKWIK